MIALFVGKNVLCHDRLPRILCYPCPSPWCLCLGRILAKSQNHVRHAIIFVHVVIFILNMQYMLPKSRGVPIITENSNFVNSHSKVNVNRHIFMCKKFSQGLQESISCELVLKCLSLYFIFQIIYIMVVKISHRDSVYIRLIVK